MTHRPLILTTSLMLLASTELVLASRAKAATPAYYNNLAAFQTEITNSVTDNYSNPGYVIIQNNAAMSAVLGETDYESTGFNNLNIVNGGYYCAGCNGSFELSFQTTTVGTSDGVQGVGLRIQVHNLGVPYFAFITFADGTTDNIPLPSAGSFWGVTAPERIERIHFGLTMGGTTTNGSFGIDDLIVGDGNVDTDGDGVFNFFDNCPLTPNPDQADIDADGLGDVCEDCPFDPNNDLDADGICSDVDVCPDIPDAEQFDADADGLGDVCDFCPFDAENDADFDGVCESNDNCPFDANHDQADSNMDGVGDACEVAGTEESSGSDGSTTEGDSTGYGSSSETGSSGETAVNEGSSSGASTGEEESTSTGAVPPGSSSTGDASDSRGGGSGTGGAAGDDDGCSCRADASNRSSAWALALLVIGVRTRRRRTARPVAGAR